MDLVQSILLHTMWVVHLFFQRLLSNRSDNKRNSRKPIMRRKIPELKRLPKVIKMKDIIDFESQTKLTPRRPTKLRRGHTISHFLFDANDEKAGLINLSDVVSPVEEEMLRWLCAKGVERKNLRPTRRRLTKACSEMCIPRDIFTNVWLNSYLTHPSQA